MSSHEQFELLCALNAAGQLDPKEQSLLEVHLIACGVCRAELGEFRQIADELASQPQIPHIAEPNERKEAARFQKFAARQGLTFSAPARRALQVQRISRFSLPALAVAAVVILACLPPTVSLIRNHRSEKLKPPALLTPVAPPSLESTNTRRDQEELLQLQNHLAAVQTKVAGMPGLERQLNQTTRERDQLLATIRGRDQEIAELRGNLRSAQHELIAAKSSLESLTKRSDDMAGELVSYRATLASLNDELREQKLGAEQERQLTAAARDVRELMGARRLYMIDVYDGEEASRATRSFGRVFYTEGKSLIFYAFDLDRQKGAKKVTFTAWGQREKDSGTIRQLGVFHIDDATQKRWVMKVDNPDKLKSVDAIFVTVENAPGGNRPEGRKFLYAYLGGQPNHP